MIRSRPRPRTLNEQKNDQLNEDRRNEQRQRANEIIHGGFFVNMHTNCPAVSVVNTNVFDISGDDICIVSGLHIDVKTLYWNVDDSIKTGLKTNIYYTKSRAKAAEMILLGGKLNEQIEAIKNAADIVVGSPKQIAYAESLRYSHLRNGYEMDKIMAISASNDAAFIIDTCK